MCECVCQRVCVRMCERRSERELERERDLYSRCSEGWGLSSSPKVPVLSVPSFKSEIHDAFLSLTRTFLTQTHQRVRRGTEDDATDLSGKPRCACCNKILEKQLHIVTDMFLLFVLVDTSSVVRHSTLAASNRKSYWFFSV